MTPNHKLLVIDSRVIKLWVDLVLKQSIDLMTSYLFLHLTNQIPETINAVPITLEKVTPSLRIRTLSRAVTNG